MGNSLQDQLRALGLARSASEKQRKKSKRTTPAKQGPVSEHASLAAAEPPLDLAWDLRAREEQAEADRRRQQKLEAERRRAEINRTIRAVVDAQRLNCEDAAIARNFLYKGRIRKVYVTVEQQHALNQGDLGIVYLAGGYHILPCAALEAVRAVSPEHVVELGGESEDGSEHPVPDDLIW